MLRLSIAFVAYTKACCCSYSPVPDPGLVEVMDSPVPDTGLNEGMANLVPDTGLVEVMDAGTSLNGLSTISEMQDTTMNTLSVSSNKAAVNSNLLLHFGSIAAIAMALAISILV